MVFHAFVFAPIGFILVTLWPSWMWLYTIWGTQARLFGYLAVCAYPLAGVLGFLAAWVYLRDGKTSGAIGVILAGVVLLLVLCLPVGSYLYLYKTPGEKYYLSDIGPGAPREYLVFMNPLWTLVLAAFTPVVAGTAGYVIYVNARIRRAPRVPL